MRMGPISTGGEPGGAAGACAKALFAGFCEAEVGEMVSGCAVPGAIACFSAAAAAPGLRRTAFLRALVESKPVFPAPDAGANVGGGPNRVCDGFVCF